MKSIVPVVAALWLGCVVVGCGGFSSSDQTQPTAAPTHSPHEKKAPRIRGMAVAGEPSDGRRTRWEGFYPREPETLRKQIDDLLAAAKKHSVSKLRALVSPHAGYAYSGPVAAVAYKQLEGTDFRTVVVMAPSHTAHFAGAMVPDYDAYETPLGNIPVSPKAAQLAAKKPFVVNPECEVRRPAFWHLSPKPLPPFGEETPDTFEHSLEVQLPFLRRLLPEVQLVPIIFGEVDPAEVAEGLAPLLDEHTLVVASSDLSHYRPYELANMLDRRTVQAILDLKADEIGPLQACGSGPICTVIALAKKLGWQAKLLDYRNSGDTSGEKRGVVGYAAIAFYVPADSEKQPPAKPGQEFSAAERDLMLKLARQSVTAAVSKQPLPNPVPDEIPEKLRQHRACFVTLNKQGQLRGCIGAIFPEEPLYQAVIRKARSAALEDTRFEPVTPEELPQIEVEISVLTLPRELDFRSPEDLLAKLRPRVDGVVLNVAGYQATFLPQVWEQIPDKEQFMSSLARKAGLRPGDWRHPQAAVLVYQAEVFHQQRQDQQPQQPTAGTSHSPNTSDR